jgi:hypothetical protein
MSGDSCEARPNCERFERERNPVNFERSVAERMLRNKVGVETMGLQRARTPHRRLGAARAYPSLPRVVCCISLGKRLSLGVGDPPKL